MYAIVDINGQQMRVKAGDEIYVNRVAADEGASVKFDRVLMVTNEGKTQVGFPGIKGSTVNATVINHLKGDKVIVFKKKRRKGYRVKNGHRQALSKIKVDAINL